MISFSTDALNKTVALLSRNGRDLFTAQQAEFYRLDFTAQRDLDTRFQAVLETRTNSDLEDVSSTQFASDTSVSDGAVFFTRVLNSLGIETTVTDDLIEQVTVTTAPARLASFITKQSRDIDLDQQFLNEKLGITEESTTKHLQVESPGLLSDEDQIIFNRLKNVHRYVRELIQ